MGAFLATSSTRLPSHKAVVVALQLLGWSTYAGLYYLSLREYQPFPEIARTQALIAAGLGLVASSLMGWAYKRWHVSRRSLTTKTAILLVTSGSLGLVWYQGTQWGAEWANPFIVPVAPYLGVGGTPLLDRGAAFPLLLLLWSGFYLGVVSWRKQQQQQKQLLRADAEAQRARLRALRYQLNPHFFFNALNTIEALASEQPERVREVVRELSGFLRYTLLDEETLEAPLQDEVQAIEHYLAVEKIRFEDDLRIDIEVPPKAGRMRVPSFLVLPLVENAVKHGQRTSPPPLRLRLTGTVENETLVLQVANTGHWRGSAPNTDGTDTGLDNVRTRLETQYPDHHRFEVVEEDGWVRARIEIDSASLTHE